MSTNKTRLAKLELIKSSKTAPGRSDFNAREWLEKQAQAINDGTNPPREPWVIKPITPDMPISLACLIRWLNELTEKENRENGN